MMSFTDVEYKLTSPNEFKNESFPSSKSCPAYDSATKSAYPPSPDSTRNPTNIVESIDPNIIPIPPANTLPNSSSGMLSMSALTVDMNDDADDSACSSGSHTLSDVEDFADGVCLVHVSAADDISGANASTLLLLDMQATATHNAVIDLFIFNNLMGLQRGFKGFILRYDQSSELVDILVEADLLRGSVFLFRFFLEQHPDRTIRHP